MCRSQVGRALSLLAAKPHLYHGDPASLASEDDYRTRVEDIDAEVGRVPRGVLSRRCLQALGLLSAAAAFHKEAVQEWLDCDLEYGSFCTVNPCAGAKPSYVAAADFRGLCGPQDYPNTSELFKLNMDVIRLTAVIIRKDWVRAERKLNKAKAVLREMAKVPRAGTNLPRSESAVDRSTYGRVLILLCSGESVPSAASEGCQSLRGILALGVTTEEEPDVNQALGDILAAYGLQNAGSP